MHTNKPHLSAAQV